jgi:hypothetical protein
MGLFDIGNMSDEQKQALQMGLFTFGTNMMQNSVGQNPTLVGSLGNSLPAGLDGYQKTLDSAKLQKANQETDPLKFGQQLSQINSPEVQNALLKARLENRTKDIPTKIREFNAFYQMTPEQQQKYIELERAGLQNQAGSNAIANYNFRNGLPPDEQQRFDVMIGKANGVTVDPNSGEVIRTQPLTAGEKKDVSKIDETIGDLKISRQLLNSAGKIPNATGSNVYSGFGSTLYPQLNRIPVIGTLFDDDKSANTTDYNNKMDELVVAYAKTLGSQPSNADRDFLKKLQGYSGYTIQEQNKIRETALNKFNQRISNNTDRRNSIVTGDMYKIKTSQSGNAGGAGDPLGIRN